MAGLHGDFAKADPFVAKLSPSGQTLFSTTLAGSDFGIAWAIAVDSTGAVYVFGNTNSPDFPVTPGALQTTSQGQFQGFVAKLDPNGKIVYSTFLGGATDVTPGLTSAPALDSILVDSAGDAIITGVAGTNTTIAQFPPAPAPIVSNSGSFVLKLDPTSSGPLAPSTGAFQSEPSSTACGLLGAFATYVTGEYGATPAAISVDAKGDVFVAGTTISPDYPPTPNAYEPQYLASAAPKVSCFFHH